MPRLQLGVSGLLFVGQCLVLSGDDIYTVLRLAITPKLNMGGFEISQVMKISIST